MHAETETADSTPADADGYAALARVVPLRPIRSAEQLHRAIAQINTLIDRQSELTPGELDYMDVLGLIVEDYEILIYGEPSDDADDKERE